MDQPLESPNPIRAYRERAQLSLAQLATAIGVGRNTVWRWENGRIPERKQWPAIERATGIKPEELIRIPGAA